MRLKMTLFENRRKINEKTHSPNLRATNEERELAGGCMAEKSQFDHVIADLKKSADSKKRELIQLLEVRNRDYALMNKILDRYIEYQHAAELLRQNMNRGNAT
jgi:hypothetical protein